MIMKVIVVGAGLAGQTISNGLASLGYHVHLVERRPNLERRRGGAYICQPNALKALYEVVPELQSELDDLGVDVPSSGGKLYAWWMIRDALFERVQKNGKSIRVHQGWTFDSFADDPQCPAIKARFTRTQEEEEEEEKGEESDSTVEEECLELEGCLLIGADGINSGVRSFLELPPAEPVGSFVWRGTIQVPEDHPVLGKLLHEGVHPIGYVPLGDGTTAVSLLNFHTKYPGVMTWSISTKDESASHPRQAVEPYLAGDDNNRSIAAIVNAIFELADPEDIRWRIPFKTTKLPDGDEKGWGGRGRVTLVGDAARGIRSAGGQAGGMAFEDVCVFIRRLKAQSEEGDTLGSYESTEAMVREFENSRLPRTRKIWYDAAARIERVYSGVKLSEEEEKRDKEVLEWIYKGV